MTKKRKDTNYLSRLAIYNSVQRKIVGHGEVIKGYSPLLFYAIGSSVFLPFRE